MGKILKKTFTTEYFLSFLTAALFALIGFALAGVWPFGEYSASCSDMRLQYLEMTSGLFNSLKKGASIFIAYQGLGTNLYPSVISIIFDPLNIIFLFFDKTVYSDVYLFITIIKYGIIALCSSIFLKKSRYTALAGMPNIALSVIYAFGGFCIKCAINVMWLEGVALLPIILLGIEYIIEERRFSLLLFSYAYFLLTDYYLAYMAGLFAVLYFVFYYTVQVQKDNIKPKHIAASLLLCGMSVVLAAGCAAVAMLPSFMNVNSSYSDMFEGSITSVVRGWSLKEIAASFMSLRQNGSTAAVIYGFYGIITLYLPLLLVLSSTVPLKERAAAFSFILFMILSLAFHPLYLVWHLFREPTGFFGRFIFTTAFLLIMLSARYLSRYSAPSKALLYLPAVILTVLSFYPNSTKSVWQRGNIIITAAFVFLYAVVFSYKNSRIFKNTVSSLILCESFIMCTAGIYVLKHFDNWTDRDYRLGFINDANKLMAETDDPSFYRMTDVSSTNTNLPFGIGYNSLETFSSQTNQKSLEKLSQLGLWCPYDYRASANYFNNTVSEGLFGVKYVMATTYGGIIPKGDKYIHTLDDKTDALRLLSDNYKLKAANEGGFLYENTHAFPLMFAVDERAVNADKDFYKKEDYISGSYKNQESFLNALFGTDMKLYDEYIPDEYEPMNAEKVSASDEPFAFYDLNLTNLPKDRSEAEYDLSQLGFIGYKLTADKDGEYFIDARYGYQRSDMTSQKVIYAINGTPLLCLYNEYSNLLTNDIGPFKAGETINIDIQTVRSCKLARPLILRLRQEEYDKFYELSQQNALQNIREDRGAIIAESNFNNDRLIFASLSYDEGFGVYIDGKKAEKICIADAFLGFRLPAGKHDIQIKYISPGFKSGACISLISLSASIVILYILKLKKSKAK